MHESVNTTYRPRFVTTIALVVTLLFTGVVAIGVLSGAGAAASDKVALNKSVSPPNGGNFQSSAYDDTNGILYVTEYDSGTSGVYLHEYDDNLTLQNSTSLPFSNSIQEIRLHGTQDLYFSGGSGEYGKLHVNGTVMWSVAEGARGTNFGLSGSYFAPVHNGEVAVYSTGVTGEVDRTDAEFNITSDQLAADDQPVESVAIAPGEDFLYVGDYGYDNFGFNMTGHKMWQTDFSETMNAFSHDGTVYTISYDKLYSVSRSNGEMNQIVSYGSDNEMKADIYDGQKFFNSQTNSFTKRYNGDDVWTAELDNNGNAEGVHASKAQDGTYHVFSTFRQGIHKYSENYEALTEDLAGQVIDQNGDPVENATVEVWGVDFSNLQGTIEEKQEEANEMLSDLENVEPQQFDLNLDLEANFSETSSEYVAVHTEDDWALSGYIDSPDLTPPSIQIPEGEELYLSAWDPSKTASSGSAFFQNGIDEQLPGATVNDETIEITQLDHQGDTVQSFTTEIDQTYEVTAGPFSTSESYYTTVSLSPGFYEVSVVGSPHSYVVQVGDPIAAIEEDLRDEADQLTEAAQRLQDRLEEGKLTRLTNETGDGGDFYFDVPTSVERVGIQAYKGPLEDISLENRTLEDLRDLRLDGYNGTILFAEPEHVDVPTDGVIIKALELDYGLPFGDINSLEDLLEWLEGELLDSEWLEELISGYLEDMTLEELQDIHDTLFSLVEQNDALYDLYEEKLPDGYEAEPPETEDMDLEELKVRVDALQQAIILWDDDIVPEPPEIDPGDGTVSAVFPFDASLEPEGTAVLVHWNNGTTEPMDEDYWEIRSSGILSGDEIVVDEFPIGDEPSVNLEPIVATDGGGGSGGSHPIVNPGYDGTVPRLNAIDVSSLSPGPDDRVAFEIRPESGTGYDSLISAEAYAPDGTELNVTTDGERARFDTNGQGSYFVRATYANQAGDQFVETFSVDAGEQPRSDPPRLAAQNGATGPIAIAGDGLRSGRLDVSDDGSQITMEAILPGGADAPGELHLHPGSVGSGSAKTVNVQLLRGDSKETVRQHTNLVVHLRNIDEQSLIWRNSEAIRWDGDTRFGEVLSRDGGKYAVRSYTDEHGATSIQVDTDPGVVDRARHWASATLPDIPGSIGLGAIIPTIIGSVALPGAVYLKRRVLP